MPLVGQMTIENPARHWVQQAEMVENDPGRTDIPAVLSGQWWGLSGGRDATIMVTNASGNTVAADVFLAFGGHEHKLDPLVFNPNETKLLSLADMLAGLNLGVAQAPQGRIAIIQRGPNPSLVAQGRVTDPVTGFSTTLEFPDPAKQHASALHASGIPVGTPTADSPYVGDGTFTPHVIASNLSNERQNLAITVEYPKSATWNSANGPGGPAAPLVRFTGRLKKGAKNPNEALDHPPNPDPSTLTGQLALGSMTVGPDSTVDFSLAAYMNQMPLPVPYASIRIQYSGAPGSMIAQVSSVDEHQNLVVDARTMNEGDGWAGSGANPWHLDATTQSILFLTDEGDKPARIGFSVTVGDTHYYLTSLMLAPHETRAINLRQLRDAQVADFKKNKIPAGASDGSVNWVRADNVPVEGRLIVVRKQGGVASSYDCTSCPCPLSDYNLLVEPMGIDVLPGDAVQFSATQVQRDCNYNLYYGGDWTNYVNWSSSNTSVATVNSTGYVTAQAGGSTTISATELGGAYTWSMYAGCYYSSVQMYGSGTLTVGAYPVNFHQVDGFDAGGGVLHFDYIWGSSTGNLSDLSNCTVNENVTYPGTANPYDWPTPPWIQGTPNPTIAGVAGNTGGSQDNHYTGYFSPPPYSSASFTAVQKYTYTCYSGALQGTLLGPLDIARSVSQNSDGTFKYTGTKNGVSASCTVPNCTQAP